MKFCILFYPGYVCFCGTLKNETLKNCLGFPPPTCFIKFTHAYTILLSQCRYYIIITFFLLNSSRTVFNFNKQQIKPMEKWGIIQILYGGFVFHFTLLMLEKQDLWSSRPFDYNLSKISISHEISYGWFKDINEHKYWYIHHTRMKISIH